MKHELLQSSSELSLQDEECLQALKSWENANEKRKCASLLQEREREFLQFLPQKLPCTLFNSQRNLCLLWCLKFKENNISKSLRDSQLPLSCPSWFLWRQCNLYLFWRYWSFKRITSSNPYMTSFDLSKLIHDFLWLVQVHFFGASDL